VVHYTCPAAWRRITGGGPRGARWFCRPLPAAFGAAIADPRVLYRERVPAREVVEQVLTSWVAGANPIEMTQQE